MREKTLEEQANDLLREDCRRQKKSFRQCGLIDARRQRTINERELPVSIMRGHGATRERLGLDDYEEDTNA